MGYGARGLESLRWERKHRSERENPRKRDMYICVHLNQRAELRRVPERIIHSILRQS